MKKPINNIMLWCSFIIMLAIFILFEVNGWPVGGSLCGIGIGAEAQYLEESIRQALDSARWMTTQRRLTRHGDISNDTSIRISFAYLYRIKVGDKYFLVENARGTGKYQPVGGVYKMFGNEKVELKNKYNVLDDNKITIDESSKDDYRLRVPNKHLKEFVKRFDNEATRESINDLSREFKEELIDKNIVDWAFISYRFCGRHMTDLHWSSHFQCYEILLADIVELILTQEQEEDLKKLMDKPSKEYRFVSAEEILSVGIITGSGELKETIADHSEKILQESEGKLMKITSYGNKFTVSTKV